MQQGAYKLHKLCIKSSNEKTSPKKSQSSKLTSAETNDAYVTLTY